MSYLRPLSVFRFVEKTDSADYVFRCDYEDGVEFIEDYDDVSNEGLCEILCGVIDKHYKLQVEKDYFMKQLAMRLNVKLKDKPLTEEQAFDEKMQQFFVFYGERKKEVVK